MKNIGSARLHRPGAREDEVWPQLDAVLSNKTIDWDLIARNYDQMIKYDGASTAGGGGASDASPLHLRRPQTPHLAPRADASDDAAVKALAATVGETYGRLEALVNNAGLTSQTPADDLDGVDLAEWDRVFAVNVRGLFQVIRACGPAAGSPQPRGERGLDRRAPAGSIFSLITSNPLVTAETVVIDGGYAATN